MSRSKKDEIVGGKNAQPTDIETVQPNSLPGYLIQEKLHEDIFAMYEAGVSPANIARKYPLYSPKEVLELCASNYDLSNIDENQLDAVLLKGFLRDLTRLDTYVKNHVDDEKFLEGARVLLDARERTAKFRSLLTPKLTSSSDKDYSEEVTMTWTIEQKITRILKNKSPEEANKLVERLETAKQDEINQILEAEFRELGETMPLLPERISEEGPPDPKTIIG